MVETYEARRQRRALTAELEKRALHALARRLPAWVTSDHLTVLGVLGAAGVSASYALSGSSPHWLWLASLMLVVNWFGDSLDGTVARVRGSERPRYGYYLDHAVDGMTTVMIGAGLGLSPLVDLRAAMAVVIVYLLMSINVYLETSVRGVFRMDYGILGPTEIRIILIALNTGLVWLMTRDALPASTLSAYGTGIVLAAATAMILMLLARFFRTLRELGRMEPTERME